MTNHNRLADRDRLIKEWVDELCRPLENAFIYLCGATLIALSITAAVFFD
jgi:hypothetical protein